MVTMNMWKKYANGTILRTQILFFADKSFYFGENNVIL
jgi:hypothetical protein